MIISIDGPAGSGKSTLAKALRQMFDKTPYALNTLCISAKKIGDIYKSREESDSWNRINTATCKILFIDDFGMEVKCMIFRHWCPIIRHWGMTNDR